MADGSPVVSGRVFVELDGAASSSTTTYYHSHAAENFHFLRLPEKKKILSARA